MKSRMLSIFLMMVLALLVMSCTNPGAPWMEWRFDGPPPSEDGRPYPAMYVLGWQHGCETSTAGQSNSYYKMFHYWRQDAGLAQNKIYHKGWDDAFWYCSRYLQQYEARPFL